MSFNSKSNKYDPIKNFKLSSDGIKTINGVDSCKYLGIILDNELKRKPHIDFLVKKLSNVLRVIYRIRYYLSKTSLLLFTNSLFITHINNGILCGGRTKKTDLHAPNSNPSKQNS